MGTGEPVVLRPCGAARWCRLWSVVARESRTILKR